MRRVQAKGAAVLLNLSAFLVGILFAVGLGVSGMTQPTKVVSFLDFFGKWDPSLMFVMIGAIAIHAATYRWIIKQNSPLLTVTWHLPTKKEITPALIFGSILFGVGWGLGGYCPGPALSAVASFSVKPLVFIGFMILGIFLFRVLNRFFNFRT